ncbi:MAG: ATP-binding protein [Bryobacter sp.]
MKSLYVKITLWTLVAFFISATATVYTMWAINRNVAGRPGSLGRMADWQMDQAITAYRGSGAEGLTGYFEELNRYFPGGHYLLDATTGKDLLTGEDRSSLYEGRESAPPRGPLFPGITPRRFIIVRHSDDGKFTYLVQVDPPINQNNMLLPMGLIFFFLCAFSYGLFRYLASPLRQLSQTVERFGQGDLGARVSIERRDEIGVLAARFNEMADRIQTLLAAERRLLEDVSHELRSPLARMQFALSALPKAEGSEASLARLRKELDRLGELVAYLLEVTRAEGDPESLRREEVDLSGFVRDLVEDCRIEADAKRCTLEFAPPGPVLLLADRELLRRAVENVLRNAIRYAPEATAIQIGLEKKDRWVHLRIADAGPGVPEEMLTKIFQPFYRVDASRSAKTGGVGLGLAITQRAVALHQGIVEARNGKPGLSVEIALPLAA